MDGTKQGRQPLEHLRSRPWAPFPSWCFSNGSHSEATTHLPPTPDSLCPDSHRGPRNVDSVLQSRTPTGLRWWIALKHKLSSLPENKKEPVIFLQRVVIWPSHDTEETTMRGAQPRSVPYQDHSGSTWRTKSLELFLLTWNPCPQTRFCPTVWSTYGPALQITYRNIHQENPWCTKLLEVISTTFA